MAKLYGNNTTDFAAINLMSFGKSFSRLNGQPLDKSEIWYNDFAALQAYALTDAAYVGQKVAFIETVTDDSGNITTGSVTHYSIEIDGSLKELGSEALAGNIESILKILNGGEAGEPGLIARVTSLETNTYTKTQTEEKIAEQIAAVDHLKREIVTVLPALDDADLNTIYMVPASDPEDNDTYDEYMVFKIDGGVDSEGIELPDIRQYEKVGSWNVDLSGYVTKSDLENVNEAIENLDNTLSNEIERAKEAEEANATAASNAQSTANTASTNATLALNQIVELQNTKVDQAYTKVPVIDENSGHTLTEDEFKTGTFYIKQDDKYIVASEYDATTIYYTQAKDDNGAFVYTEIAHTLLTPEEKEKLNSLVLGEDGGVEISGTVNIQNVQGLAGYLTEEHFSTAVNNKLNYITDVDPTHFTVTDNQLLFTPTIGRLLTVEDEAQLHLIEAVDDTTFEIKPTIVGQDTDGKNIIKNTLYLISVSAAALQPTLGDLSKLPTIEVGDTISNTIVDNINNIYSILTWGEMTI